METKTIKQTVLFNATPHEVYEALMDSKKHAKITGAPANISREVGGEFNAYDGGLTGTNIELVADKKIVQKWRCVMDEWPEDHYSTASFLLKKVDKGTELTFVQTDVPKSCYEEISNGWEEYYWENMKKMFKK